MPSEPLQQVGPLEAGASTAQLEKKLSDAEVHALVEAAQEARSRAHCPYSKFSVGAALLTEDNNTVLGCNVENISYGLSVCAERTAVCSAVVQGYKRFKAIAITADMGNRFVGPCGMCRQTLVEFGTDWEVYLANPAGRYMKTTVASLLPDSFSPDWVTLP